MNASARSLWILPVAAMLAVLQPTAAFSQQPGAAMPPGHPPVGPTDTPPAPQGLPEGHPPITGAPTPAPPLPDNPEEGQPEGMALPPGHPPIGGAGATPGGPGMPMPGAASSPVTDDPSLRPGTVILQVRDGQGKVVTGIDLVLQITRKSISEGESRTEKTARVDAEGQARFEGLQIGSEWSYQASAKHASISYSSPAFQMSPMSGKRVTVKVFDATRDIDAALVGVQAFVALEPREEFLQVEQIFHFANLGDRTFIIPEWIVPLERGFQAFTGTDESSEIRIEPVEGRGFKVTGFVRPGAHEASLRYQVPYSSSDSIHVSAWMLPRVAQVRVISAAAGQTRMRVEGMPEPISTKGNEGQKLLVTERLSPAGGDQIDLASITIQGLPTPGPARWYALAAAVTAIVVGLYLALRGSQQSGAANDPELRGDIEKAKQVVLEEIATLEKSRKAGDLGPKTYEHTRRTLVDSLARLLAIEKTTHSIPQR